MIVRVYVCGGDLCGIYRLDKKRRDEIIGDLWKAIGDCVRFRIKMSANCQTPRTSRARLVVSPITFYFDRLSNAHRILVCALDLIQLVTHRLCDSRVRIDYTSRVGIVKKKYLAIGDCSGADAKDSRVCFARPHANECTHVSP